jgi:hypothetical protein
MPKYVSSQDQSVVPFGKYRGQPVDVMLADRGYLEWIMAQPGIMTMIQGKYPALLNIITVGAPTTDDTPEHNKLQAMFLNREFQYAFVETVLGKSVYATSSELAQKLNEEGSLKLENAKRLIAEQLIKAEKRFVEAKQETASEKQKDGPTEYRKEKAEHEKRIREHKDHGYSWDRSLEPFHKYQDWLDAKDSYWVWHSWPGKVKRLEDDQKKAFTSLEEVKVTFGKIFSMPFVPIEPCRPKIHLTFECGFDLQMIVEWETNLLKIPEWNGQIYSGGSWIDTNIREQDSAGFFIELKPQTGDDFPAVLRQIKRNCQNASASASGWPKPKFVLVIDSFESSSCTIEEVRAIFDQIKIVTVAEIQANINRGLWPIEGMPPNRAGRPNAKL